MTIGVILNRVFRINNNPLFEYIHQNKEEIEKCYLIIPQEIFEEDGTNMKANYYYGVMQSFLNDLRQYDIEPFLLDYSDLGDFVKINLSVKLLFGDIMSYHQESYDIRHLKRLLTSTILQLPQCVPITISNQALR